MSALDPLLIACAADVGYEFKMIGALGKLKTPIDLPFVGYGLLESLLVHVRLLDDFLANKVTHKDDLIARHYNPTWPSKGFLKPYERAAISKKVAHLTRSRQDQVIDQAWRATGALDAEGKWHRIDLAKRALASASRFVELLDPAIKTLFQPALTEAWKYHLASHELGFLVGPYGFRTTLQGNRLTLWVGTSVIVVHDFGDEV